MKVVVVYFKIKYENSLARTIKFASNKNQLKEQGAKRLLPPQLRADLQEVGCGCMDWIGLVQDKDRWRASVKAVMNLWVP
jgi:hypothetical protein